jgi:Fe-S oxidoreductase
MLKSPMMPAADKTLWAKLPECSANEALMLKPAGDAVKTVFYFPGCGSERLYSDISMAAIYVLLKSNVRVILPPPFLCCGFPAKVNAKKTMHDELTLRNTIILSQIREMLGYMVFDKFVVSCGTCRESIHEIGAGEIFDCEVQDVSRFVLENSELDFGEKKMNTVLYHAPCHDSFDGDGAALVRRIAGEVKTVPNCCSEAGTLAISRPDISYKMMQRKRESIAAAKEGVAGEPTIVTNCPSCISGLGRNRDLGVNPQHMAVMLAKAIGGESWESDLERLLGRTEKVTF